MERDGLIASPQQILRHCSFHFLDCELLTKKLKAINQLCKEGNKRAIDIWLSTRPNKYNYKHETLTDHVLLILRTITSEQSYV